MALGQRRPAGRTTSVTQNSPSHQANISDEEEAAFKKAARQVLELTDQRLATLIQNGQFTEVDDHD
jgi:hypothetical protein